MHNRRTFALFALVLEFLTLTAICTAQYVPPNPTILPLYPRGLRMFIPDEEGITLVAFHAKFNEDFDGLEAGTIARDIVKVKNNRWTYEDRTTRLKIGDVIYLWIHVIYEGLGYNLLDQVLHVTEFYNIDGTLHTPGPTPPITTTSEATPSCRRSITLHNGQQPCAGQLIFEEKFDQLDPNKWRILKQFSGTPDFEFVVYQGREENVCVRNGELRIKPTLLEEQYNAQFVRTGTLIIDSCTGRIGSEECESRAHGFHILPPVASGMIDTKQSCNFLFGRVQIRAKLPQGDWIYPVIMLNPVVAVYGAGYQSGQLRIASAAGNRHLHTNAGINLNGTVLRGGAVVSPENSIRQSTMSKKISNNYWSDDYHVYELEWTPTTITVSVDGEKYGEMETSVSAAHKEAIFEQGPIRWISQNAPFDGSFYLSLGVAVGGRGEFPDGSMSGSYSKPWRNREAKADLHFFNATNTWRNTWTDEGSTLKIDEVKIWAL